MIAQGAAVISAPVSNSFRNTGRGTDRLLDHGRQRYHVVIGFAYLVYNSSKLDFESEDGQEHKQATLNRLE